MTPRPYRDFRLAPGHHRLSAEEVASNQRWRLIGAAAEVVARQGLDGTTARMISHEAGVSPSTLYRHFEGVDDLLAAGAATGAQALEQVVGEACAAAGGDKATAVLRAVIEFTSEESALCGLLGLGPAGAVTEIAALREIRGRRVGELLGAARVRADPSSRHRVAAALALILDHGGESGEALVDELGLLLAWPRRDADAARS